MMDEISKVFMRIVHTIRPGKQTTDSNETGVIGSVQVAHNAFEVRQLNTMQLFGFASATKAGCDLMAINVAGDNSNGVVVASNDQRYRPTGMQPGEVQVYDANGQRIYVKSDGSIRISANHQVDVTCDTSMNLTCPIVNIDGSLRVTGDITDNCNTNTKTIADMRTIFDEHTHGDVQNGGGTTSTPSPQM